MNKFEEILQNTTSCTITEEADIDDYNNHYYDYKHALTAMETASKLFADWIILNGFEGYASEGKCWWQRVNDHAPFSTKEVFEIFKEGKP